jgi:hypothetical protein
MRKGEAVENSRLLLLLVYFSVLKKKGPELRQKCLNHKILVCIRALNDKVSVKVLLINPLKNVGEIEQRSVFLQFLKTKQIAIILPKMFELQNPDIRCQFT